MMQDMAMLERAIHDRQVRYRHEAYRGRSASRPLRVRIGVHLIQLGELMRGEEHPGPARALFDRAPPPVSR